MYKVMCMSFDGDYQVEHPEFETIQEAWEYSNNLGSKWFFYPFHFVITATEKSIADAPELLEWTINKRIRTVKQVFEQTSKRPEVEGLDAIEYCFEL